MKTDGRQNSHRGKDVRKAEVRKADRQNSHRGQDFREVEVRKSDRQKPRRTHTEDRILGRWNCKEVRQADLTQRTGCRVGRSKIVRQADIH